MKTVKMAVIGHRNRGRGLLEDILLNMADVEIIGVCDLYPDRAEAAADRVEQKTGKRRQAQRRPRFSFRTPRTPRPALRCTRCDVNILQIAKFFEKPLYFAICK